ncbi:MAG: FadR family transcriptional regulator [Deltaproteobacteria bacterium]|nr:FadR family transcriptional regulator [Deltaproteobacteria bacterium]
MSRILKKKTADYVLEEIRQMILKGQLNQGDKLPNQNEFAEQLGVSRPSLREALQTLTQIGAIEQRPGMGTVLVSKAHALIANNLNLPFMSDAQGTIELTEIRHLIETGMIALAVVRATNEEIAEIAGVLKEAVKAARKGNIEEYYQQDLVFHHLIAKATHNRYVMHVFQTIRQSLEQFLREAFLVMPEAIDQSAKDHLAILEALKSRNQGKAVEAMSRHLLMVQEKIEGFYQKKQEEGHGA